MLKLSYLLVSVLYLCNQLADSDSSKVSCEQSPFVVLNIRTISINISSMLGTFYSNSENLTLFGFLANQFQFYLVSLNFAFPSAIPRNIENMLPQGKCELKISKNIYLLMLIFPLLFAVQLPLTFPLDFMDMRGNLTLA